MKVTDAILMIAAELKEACASAEKAHEALESILADLTPEQKKKVDALLCEICIAHDLAEELGRELNLPETGK